MTITSCAIITTAPNGLLATIHDRMPVILTSEAQEKWLRKNVKPAELKEILVPFPESEMKSFPVSSQVNHPQNDEARLVEQIDIRREQTTGMLF